MEFGDSFQVCSRRNLMQPAITLHNVSFEDFIETPASATTAIAPTPRPKRASRGGRRSRHATAPNAAVNETLATAAEIPKEYEDAAVVALGDKRMAVAVNSIPVPFRSAEPLTVDLLWRRVTEHPGFVILVPLTMSVTAAMDAMTAPVAADPTELVDEAAVEQDVLTLCIGQIPYHFVEDDVANLVRGLWSQTTPGSSGERLKLYACRPRPRANLEHNTGFWFVDVHASHAGFLLLMGKQTLVTLEGLAVFDRADSLAFWLEARDAWLKFVETRRPRNAPQVRQGIRAVTVAHADSSQDTTRPSRREQQTQQLQAAFQEIGGRLHRDLLPESDAA